MRFRAPGQADVGHFGELPLVKFVVVEVAEIAQPAQDLLSRIGSVAAPVDDVVQHAREPVHVGFADQTPHHPCRLTCTFLTLPHRGPGRIPERGQKQPGPGWDGVGPGHKRVILPRGKYHDYMAPHLDKPFAVMPVSSVWFVTIVDVDLNVIKVIIYPPRDVHVGMQLCRLAARTGS